jgi:multidrug efflux pump subunit AcrB
VTAPISGQIGRCLVDPGNIVLSETQLASLVVPDPMYVHFDIDERTLLRLLRLKQDGKGEAGKISAAVGLIDEESISHTVVLEDFRGCTVDPATGTVSLRAILPNKDGLLVPGMFVRVRLTLGAPHKGLLVSEQAIGSEPDHKHVYVLDAENKVQQRRVTLGALQPDGLRLIVDGLKPDDRVVVGRLAGLRPGMAVQPDEIEMPAPKRGQTPEKAPPAKEIPSTHRRTGPGTLVQAAYPGASAQVVSETVRAPIEEQVRGVNKVRYLRSRCTSDGRYALNVIFSPGVDPDLSQVLIQNRVALALPAIPSVVQIEGITVRRGTSGVVLFVNLFSPDGRFDREYLGRYASIQVRDELSRLGGVSEVALLGNSDVTVRVRLDPLKLAAHNMSSADVARVFREEKFERDRSPDKLQDLAVKAGEKGQVVRLRDVASIDLGVSQSRSEAYLDGKPAASLVIYLDERAKAKEARTTIREKLAELRKRLPAGLDLDVTFDFTANLETPKAPAAPEYLLVDLDLADAVAERTSQPLSRCETLLRQLPEVKHVLAFSENPFDLFGSHPCLALQLSSVDQRKSSREEIIRTIRTRLGTVEKVTARVRDLSAPGCFPRCGYPLDVALHGPKADQVKKWAGRLAERLRQNNKLTDVWVNADSTTRPERTVDINRDNAIALGVAVEDIYSAIELFSDSVPVTSFERFGLFWGVELQIQGLSGTRDLGNVQVRNKLGQMVPLASLVKVREVELPLALDFLDSRPMLEITANPASDVSAEAGQKLIATLADEVRKELRLPAEYRLTWLQDLPKGK